MATIVGLMLRSDHLGTTSIIRDLSLNPACYEALNHFFRSSAWSLESLWQTWLHIVGEYALSIESPMKHV